MGLLIQLLLLLVLVTPPAPVSRLPREGEELAGELADDESNAYYIATGFWAPAGRCRGLALSIAVGDNENPLRGVMGPAGADNASHVEIV